MKQKILIILAVISLFITTSCSDDNDKINTYTPAVTVELPEEISNSNIVEELYQFKNISTGNVDSYKNKNEIKVIPGLYNISYDATVIATDNVEKHIKAYMQSVQITDNKTAVNIKSFLANDCNDFVISEIFFTRTLQASGAQYGGDDYIKIYNNTDHVLYADGVTIFETKFNSSVKYDYTPNITDQYVSVDAIYTIPGNGTEHPVQPGEYMLIANNAIDHRELNPNSFDLSGADFEWYDESSNPRFEDINNPNVPDLDKWYCYTNTYWNLHNRGLQSYGIARISTNKEQFLENNYYDFTYNMVLPSGTYPMNGNAFKILNSDVIDMVNLGVASIYKWNVTSPSLDAGWTHCGEIDMDPTRYFHSVRRKMLYLNANNKPFLKDTNNSSEDFNADCIPSVIEEQGTAINASGKRATTKTYDGVIAIK